MARYAVTLEGDADALLAHLERGILGGSISANREDGTDITIGGARMVVRVYERYSAMGGNRVSLSISLLAVGQQLAVTCISAGGSQAVFFKLNTFGEESFLAKARTAIESFG